MLRFHQPSFGDASPAVLDELARVLRAVLGALLAGLDDPAYNLDVHSVPAGEEHLRYFVALGKGRGRAGRSVRTLTHACAGRPQSALPAAPVHLIRARAGRARPAAQT